MATYGRQVATKEDADREIAAIRAAGRWASEPFQTVGPNGKTVWMYSAEA